MERKMGHIEKIWKIEPIPNADAIEVVRVLGWQCVAKKGDFQVGDDVIYLEIDSWCPHELAPFLSKGKEPRVYNGIKGEKLKSIRLRGQISQGLVLPLSVLDGKLPETERIVGLDLTSILGIQKWEPDIPAQLQGQVKGNFPTHLVSKTDEERCQNNPKLLNELQGETCYISVKMDGTSATFILFEDEEHVCSRNMSLKETEGNTYWEVYKKYKLREAMNDWCKKNNKKGIAVQGEIAGAGVQKNPIGLSGVELFVFNIWNIEDRKHFSYSQMKSFCEEYGLTMVPIENDNFLFENQSVESLLEMAKGKYPNGHLREGIVIRPLEPKYSPTLQGRLSVKAINNDYLLKEK